MRANVCACVNMCARMGEYTVTFHKYSRTVVSLILKGESVSRNHTVHVPNANTCKDIVNLPPTIQASQSVYTIETFSDISSLEWDGCLLRGDNRIIEGESSTKT